MLELRSVPPLAMKIIRIANRLQDFPCILFLDLDGVLTVGEADSTIDSFRRIDQPFLDHLNHILQTTNAGIVLSTGWRTHPKILAVLANSGIDRFSQRYIGSIPDMGAEQAYWTGESGPNLADEIREWLEDAGYQGRFAVLDDREDLMNENLPLFSTDSNVGLTGEIAEQVVNHLQGPKDFKGLKDFNGDVPEPG